MDFKISKDQLVKWCSYTPKEILAMDGLLADIRVHKTVDEIMRTAGNMMADEVAANNELGKATKWICPAGPREQYAYFLEKVIQNNISLKNLLIFMMDEFLDWECRLISKEAKYGSLHGVMEREVFSKIDKMPEELRCPREQRIFPELSDLDYYDDKIEELGGIDTTWAGIGAKGLIAFCEAPHSRYYRISEEEFKNSKTRVVELNEDTLVALSVRSFGGFYDMIPPKAVTVGMKSILSSKRIIYMFREGAWKQTALRVLLFCKEPTLEYPVTFSTKYINERILLCDEMTLEHPLQNWRDDR